MGDAKSAVHLKNVKTMKFMILKHRVVNLNVVNLRSFPTDNVFVRKDIT